MAARKLANEVERCFKKVDEGVTAFEGIHEKILQATNPSQKEKLEDSLKKEIKKLQRHRDQIKAWATLNEIKDKKPLLDKRKLIETQMEKFKAVEKEMKTKAYSKEGLSAASKLDPKEKEKLETAEFLSKMVEELERQIETCEAEMESIQATMKKKKDTVKADRIATIGEDTERHKWHQGKLELLLRTLENGGVEAEQVKDVEDSIRYYVESNQEPDFMEDDTIYDDFNLQEEEDLFGMPNELDKVSSQDAQSIQDDTPDGEPRPSSTTTGKGKGPSATEPPAAAARRPSTQLKSPLPALATLHTPQAASNPPPTSMKPAPLPTRTPGEPLKYASAAAAAAASDKNGVGIAPLPPPPAAAHTSTHGAGLAPLPIAKQSTTSPSSTNSQPASQRQASFAAQDGNATRSPAPSHASAAAHTADSSSAPDTPAIEKAEPKKSAAGGQKAPGAERPTAESAATTRALAPVDTAVQSRDGPSVFHLPSGLDELLETFEATKQEALARNGRDRVDSRHLALSHQGRPMTSDAEKPRHYRPQNPFPYTPSHYPQEPLAIFDDALLYSRVDTDMLFYSFYYRQGTYQQSLAAKALKAQSWRFHKQYQTWFQRHEEPKTITEDYEQGTYRFFDYESTWMNRRKADFRFQYKFLEDEL